MEVGAEVHLTNIAENEIPMMPTINNMGIFHFTK
jgi:hypothetical protein